MMMRCFFSTSIKIIIAPYFCVIKTVAWGSFEARFCNQCDSDGMLALMSSATATVSSAQLLCVPLKLVLILKHRLPPQRTTSRSLQQI